MVPLRVTRHSWKKTQLMNWLWWRWWERDTRMRNIIWRRDMRGPSSFISFSCDHINFNLIFFYRFLHLWSSLHPLAREGRRSWLLRLLVFTFFFHFFILWLFVVSCSSGRHAQLQRLQLLTEMEEFLDWMRNAKETKGIPSPLPLLSRWANRFFLFHSFSFHFISFFLLLLWVSEGERRMSKELNVLCFSECRFPSATTHSLLHWHDVIWRRHIAFDHIYGVTKEKGSSSKEMKRSQIELAIFFLLLYFFFTL